MAYKFLDRDAWLKVVNQWVLDGSNIESFGDSQECEWFVLRGKYGAREELYYFYTEEAFEKYEDMQPFGHDPRTRVAHLSVEVNLDPVPGAFHTIESVVEVVQTLLNYSIGHYNPKVSQTV